MALREPDEQTKAVLAAMEASGAAGLSELGLEEARTALLEATIAMDAPRSELHAVEDRQVPGEGGEFTVRVYTPRALEDGQNLPLLMMYHGGGFALGDLQTHDNVCRYYAATADVIVISVHYRRPPEHKFPIAVEDCYAALGWAVENAGALGIDADRIAVTGDSAGGNISAVVCQLAKQRGGPEIAFQALVYPVVNMDKNSSYPSREKFGGGEYFLAIKDFEWLNGMYFSDEAAEVKDLRASPILAEDLGGLPAALVITAGFDPLVDEGRLYADRLREAGVAAEYKCFEGTIHGFMSFSGVIDAGKEGLALVASCLREAFGGER